VVLPALIGVACSSGDVDLGARGTSFTSGGAGGLLASGGAGGRSNAGGQSEAAAAGSSVVPASGGASSTDAGPRASIDSGSPPNTAGCGVAPLASDTSIPVDGMTGSFILDLPTNYDNRRAYPLVMVFRGANVTVSAFRSYLNLEPVVGPDAIIVTPDCLNAASAWDVQRDLPLVDALLTHLETAYCVDPTRIFAVGHSAGGFFVSTLGCMRGTELRGIAPLSAGPPSGTCTGEFAVWISQGNQDTAFGLMNGRADRDFWVQRNACDASSSTSVDPSPCVEYSACNPGFAVRYCEYNGDLGLPSFAAAGLWGFFKEL
jgi:polyhydroxybutyrate depolymerase